MTETSLVSAETELTDDELFEMAFDALVPLANQDITTKHITQQDIRNAREVLRFLTSRVAKRNKSK